MRGTLNDIAHSVRTLRKAPLFTTVVIVVLALGIGAASTVFTVVSAVVLRPVPFRDAERVVNLAWDDGEYVAPGLTSAKFAFWKERTPVFSAFASWQPLLARVGEVGQVSSARVLRVTPGFFEVVGESPAIGRVFTPEEHATAAKVALVSDEFWKRHFGEARDPSNRTLRLEEQPYAVVGVLPETFEFPYEAHPADIITPVGVSADPNDRAGNWPAIARVAPGVTTDQARAAVASLNPAFRATYPQQVTDRDRGMTLGTFEQLYVGPTTRAIWILMGSVALLLLIACANAASLFLARMLPRRAEMALRGALGATRTRIMRLVLAEGLVVSVAAGVLGVLVANWGANVLVALAPVRLPRAESVGVDWTVVLFAALMALATTTLVGGAAAWPAARAGLSQVLQEGSRTTAGRTRLQHALLAAQAALSILLLVGAGLLVTTWFNLRRVDPGFDPERLVIVELPIRPPSYDTAGELWDLERRVIGSVMQSATASSVAAASTLPLQRGLNVPVSISGRSEFGGSVEWRAVTPAYFQTVGIGVAEGRRFEESDAASAMKVAIVNRAFARKFFRDDSPIGQGVDVGRRGASYIHPSLQGPAVIVGVADDVRDVSLRAQPRPTIYVPYAQAPAFMVNVRRTMPVFIARSVVNTPSLERTFRDAIRTADPSLPEPRVFLLSETIADSLARERFGAILLAVFAAVALLLTAFGIYSVVTYSVRQRRREIGIRIAIGAGRREVSRLVVRQGLQPVAIGIALGLAGSLAISRLLDAYLWGVAPRDPRTLAVVALAVLGAAAISCWIPAREAVGIDPAKTLNS